MAYPEIMHLRASRKSEITRESWRANGPKSCRNHMYDYPNQDLNSHNAILMFRMRPPHSRAFVAKPATPCVQARSRVSNGKSSASAHTPPASESAARALFARWTPAIVGNRRTDNKPAPTKAAEMSEFSRPVRTPRAAMATTSGNAVAE
jgi:hypothetical protein